jgi:hypothetical protein
MLPVVLLNLSLGLLMLNNLRYENAAACKQICRWVHVAVGSVLTVCSYQLHYTTPFPPQKSAQPLRPVQVSVIALNKVRWRIVKQHADNRLRRAETRGLHRLVALVVLLDRDTNSDNAEERDDENPACFHKFAGWGVVTE